MRSLALGQSWIDSKLGNVHLIYYECHDKLLAYAKEHGISIIRIDDPIDSRRVMTLIDAELNEDDWIILDGYRFNGKYQSEIYRVHENLAVLDDDCYSDYFKSKVIINPNPDIDVSPYHNIPYPLVGLEYVAIKKEVLKEKKNVRKKQSINRLLITLGATGHASYLENIMPVILENHSLFTEINIVTGENWYSSHSMPHNIEICQYTDEFHRLLSGSDLLLSAAGSTLWEAFYLGVPVIAVATTDNQKQVLEALGKTNALVSLGWYKHARLNDLENMLQRTKMDVNYFTKIASTAQNLIDGKGGQRIIDSLCKL